MMGGVQDLGLRTDQRFGTHNSVFEFQGCKDERLIVRVSEPAIMSIPPTYYVKKEKKNRCLVS